MRAKRGGKFLWAMLFLVAAPARSAEMATIQHLFDGAMLPSVEVETLSHCDKVLPSAAIPKSGAARALPPAGKPFPAIRFEDRGRSFDLYDYLSDNRVAGLLVLKNGQVAFEDYELGAGPDTHWCSFSMAKSVASTLAGAALKDGAIASLDDPVTRYVPGLKGSVYDGVSVRTLLLMASGARWDETYTNPQSDRRKLLESQLSLKPGNIVDYMRTLPSAAPPGTRWNYSTGESFLIGAVVEGATHKRLADYLGEKIWGPAGMESDAAWWEESPGGMTLSGSGLSATLRDYARFGLFAAEGGKGVLPPGWFDEAGVPHKIGDAMVNYGYFWWILSQQEPIHTGAFRALGIFGQHIYVSPKQHLVIAVISARSKPSATDRLDISDEAFFAAVAKALQAW